MLASTGDDPEEVRAEGDKGSGKGGWETEIVAEGSKSAEWEGTGTRHHEEARKAGGGSRGVSGVKIELAATEEDGGWREREGGKRGVTGVGGFEEEGGVATEKAKDGDGEA